MTSQEQLRIDWHDFQKNINNIFAELRESSDFTDITLVCEDDQQIEAHKIVLSACSPFFKKIL